MKAIILIRHAQSTKNVENRFAGSLSEDDLTSTGHQQVASIVQELQSLRSEWSHMEATVWTGTSRRSVATADKIAAVLGSKCVARPALESIDGGPIAGLTEGEVASRYPDYFRALRLYRIGLLDSNRIPHMGEGLMGFERRVHGCLQEVEKGSGLGFVVAHKSVITAGLLYYARKFHEYPSTFYGFVDVPEASMSIVDTSGKGAVLEACVPARVGIQALRRRVGR